MLIMAANENNLKIIQEAFLVLSEKFLQQGALISDLEYISVTTNDKNHRKNWVFHYIYNKKMFAVLVVPMFYTIFIKYLYADIIKSFYETKCLIPNNYIIWEFTRPVSDCNYCRNVDAPLILPNLTKEEFRQYAYLSQPMIIRNAASHWSASKVFNLQYFQNLYEHIDGAYESVEEECQFLHFKSNFTSLREVFTMSQRRAMNLEGEEPWYIGWKNCHLQILDDMKKFYDPPHFLPDDAEIPYTNYIFLGYEQGAIMHLDYISRLMWQGQVLGSKTWTVAPTPECDHICKSFNFSVGTGDIILLDTRIWYHGTYVENGNLSLTLTSEYG